MFILGPTHTWANDLRSFWYWARTRRHAMGLYYTQHESSDENYITANTNLLYKVTTINTTSYMYPSVFLIPV